MKKLISALLALVLVVSLGACGSKAELGSEGNKVKIGVVGEDTDVWDFVIKKLEKEGIYVELVKFLDYNQPNEALLSGDINLNSFQHQNFLDNFNKEKKSDLISIGNTLLAPLGLYSKRIKNVSEIEDKAKVAIPNDVTNGSRSLVLLQTAGLIKLRTDKKSAFVKEDIIENPHKLEIIELDASQTARSLEDVAIAAINNGMAIDAGFDPLNDPIFLEPVNDDSKPFINIIVARNEEKDKEIYKKIVKAYQAEDTKEVIKETSKGATIPAWELKSN